MRNSVFITAIVSFYVVFLQTKILYVLSPPCKPTKNLMFLLLVLFSCQTVRNICFRSCFRICKPKS
jgi:hypothetical protein